MRRKGKKIFAVILTVAMGITSLLNTGVAIKAKDKVMNQRNRIIKGDWKEDEETETVTGTCGTSVVWSLTYNSDMEIGELTISGSGEMTSSPWKDYPVTELTIKEGVTNIAGSSFRDERLKSVTMAESVTDIGDYAFCGCSSLSSLELSSKIESIGASAFSGCEGLTSISIPGSLINMGSSAFYDCINLSVVEIQDGVTAISESAFDGCESMTEIVLPETLESIGISSFDRCSSLTEVQIPPNVTNIGVAAFANCSNLKVIQVDTSNTIFDSRNNCNAIIETENNRLIQGCNATVIPGSVNIIGEYAFAGFQEIEWIEIPDGVTDIEGNAFQYCEKLMSIKVPSSVINIDIYAFYGASNNITVYGYAGSYAETFATSKNGFSFMDLNSGAIFPPVSPLPTATSVIIPVESENPDSTEELYYDQFKPVRRVKIEENTLYYTVEDVTYKYYFQDGIEMAKCDANGTLWVDANRYHVYFISYELEEKSMKGYQYTVGDLPVEDGDIVSTFNWGTYTYSLPDLEEQKERINQIAGFENSIDYIIQQILDETVISPSSTPSQGTGSENTNEPSSEPTETSIPEASVISTANPVVIPSNLPSASPTIVPTIHPTEITIPIPEENLDEEKTPSKVKTSGNTINLLDENEEVLSTANFNKKKATLQYNGLKLKSVKMAAFTKKGTLIYLKKNGKAYYLNGKKNKMIKKKVKSIKKNKVGFGTKLLLKNGKKIILKV